jgi:transposase
MKNFTRKSRLVMTIERMYGFPIEEVLRKKYVDEGKPALQLADELGVSYATVIAWLKKAGIYGRKLNL